MYIAILTLPLHTNYGGILQAYALQTVLERLGNKVCLITIPTDSVKHSKLVMPLVYVKRCVRKICFNEDISIRYDQYNRPKQHTEKFIRKHINQFLVEDFRDFPDCFDAIVVGSDQIWRPRYAAWFPSIETVFLDFIDATSPIRRIAYAASFGVDEWEYTDAQTQSCAELASRFDAISVREDTGVDLCERYLNVNARHVLDPTMLLSASDYLELVGDAPKRQHPYIMSYILDSKSSSDMIVTELSALIGAEIVIANSRVEDPLSPPKDRIQPPVENWIQLISCARCIVTDSFHACVFSILFHKPFYVISNNDRGNSRIESLLEPLGLINRIVSNCPQDVIDIDYDRVDAILQGYKDESRSFLISALSV